MKKRKKGGNWLAIALTVLIGFGAVAGLYALSSGERNATSNDSSKEVELIEVQQSPFISNVQGLGNTNMLLATNNAWTNDVQLTKIEIWSNIEQTATLFFIDTSTENSIVYFDEYNLTAGINEFPVDQLFKTTYRYGIAYKVDSQCFSSSVSGENNNGLYTVRGSIALGNTITYSVEVATYSVAVNLIGLVEV